MTRWHHHTINDIPLFSHAHPGDTEDHDHQGYTLVREINRGPRLMRDGVRLPGEITPAETLGFDGGRDG